MTAYLTLNGEICECATIHIPNIGPWWAECDFVDEAPRATGAVQLQVGSVTLLGTVDPKASGLFAGIRRVRVVGGAGGWSSLLAPKAYHNDAGVPRLAVASDAASAVGETLGFFQLPDRLPVDYVRPAGAASETLTYVASGLPWWVGFDGLTHVGDRAATVAGRYSLLNYNTRDKVAELDVDSIDAVGIGAVLSDRLEPAITVRDITITITPKGLSFRVWHSDAAATRGQLAQALTAVVARVGSERLLGAYTYRVTGRAGSRLNLEPVKRDGDLPSLSYVDMWPGLPGAYPEVTPGSQVVVQFRDGDRRSPMVTQFAPKGSPGFVPVSFDLSGDGSGLAIARQGDLVQCGGAGTIVTLWPTLTPPAPPNAAVVAGVPHFISFDPSLVSLAAAPLAAPLFGAVATGSGLGRCG